MAYINGGVEMPHNVSKKALKEAVQADPSKVFFYSTSPLGATYDGYLDKMPEGVTLQVTGPDPFKARKWYASVKLVNGVIKVS